MLGILHSYLLLHKNGAFWHVINIRLTFITHWNCFWIFLSLSSSFSSLFPFFPFSSLFFGFCFHCAILESPSSFSLCWYSPGMLMGWMLLLTWSSLVTFLVNFDCRFWTKTHLISLKNAHGPHIILLFWMLLRGWLTCLFFLLPTILLSFASDTVVSF